jgi:hypothetical protein
MYVAQKLSSLSATVGKETSHRNGPVLLRQVRLEGLIGQVESARHRNLPLVPYLREESCGRVSGNKRTVCEIPKVSAQKWKASLAFFASYLSVGGHVWLRGQ